MNADRSPDLTARIELLDSLAFLATEHEGALDLASLVAYVDLYARHLELAGPDADMTPLALEAFVGDAHSLEVAARAAERATGVPTRSPGPLGTTSVPPGARAVRDAGKARLVSLVG